MSDTHAHRPWWTHSRDPRLVSAVCDHRDGPCDLPAVGEAFAAARSAAHHWPATRCRWEIRHWAVPPACGCALCTGRDERRTGRRRDRRMTRARLRRGDADGW